MLEIYWQEYTTNNGPPLHNLVQRRPFIRCFSGSDCLGAPGSGAGFDSCFGPHVY
jgi:hypothetical protein